MPFFSAATQAWFDGAFADATAAQLGAWESIAEGSHTLVVAPTGSGKTLAAFLYSLDRLAAEPPPADPMRRCRVLYVSPLKALAVDVERNLRSPLAGIRQASVRLGLPAPDISVAMRSGDTAAQERRLFARQPTDILITTPESLFLMLTSQARESLRGIDTVIIDEVHAVCATKRGAHLAVTLERLDALLDRPAQRVGLSATVRPTEEVANFLAGGRPVTVVEPPSAKVFDLQVVVPVEDMTALGEPTGDLSGAAAGNEQRTSIWPHVEERIVDLIEQHRSTIVFANSRRLAERLTSRLNEIATSRQGLAEDPVSTSHAPAAVMAQAGSGAPAGDVVIAKAHHGSVSREQRAIVEEQLKAGQLPAVVATSSLELGIDMGAVDLVIQVESPPSVASGLQRVGRAGHQVGAVSEGVIFPKYRGDLLECAVVAERMREGSIESMRYPRNPLDVLAQQIVAMVSMEEWSVNAVEELFRRAAPFAALPHSALLAVLDMLAGRYPSDAFAELRPRLVWDRVADTLTGRAGAQRLAVTSGGTIPDRGLFAVFLASGEGPGRRVGELDEEMVYESRVGDVFLLGSSSWRIEDITHDRVLVSPAPGQIGKMPFWRGDSLGRPVELGRALGHFLRDINQADHATAASRAMRAGLDEWGTANLLTYLAEQREATGQTPDDRTVLVERFRDELGDWRLVVHSPFGAPVNAPWSLAIGARLREEYGLDVQAMHSDDGIVLRLPETDGDAPGAELALFDPEEIDGIVTREVSNSALFASRFRECAARSLLLPRRDPTKRTPLWQQRQRANQLLQVASEFSDFPVVLEAMRECVQDVYDVPGLVGIMQDLKSRRLKLVEVETPTPSPFARSLLFGYVGMFLYDGDAPLAERRAQALSLDSAVLAELLGTTDLRELLDIDSLSSVEAELQRLPDERHARGIDAVHDLLRGLGDLTTDEALARGATREDLTELERQRRLIRVRIAGQERWCAIEDAGRLRDALGTALPVGVPEAFTEPVRDPVGDLIARFARTHGPFQMQEVAQRLGLGVAVVQATLQRLASSGTLVEGAFRPLGTADVSGAREWCDATVLRLVRRRSLAALRREIEPVRPAVLAKFTTRWQNVGSRSLRGSDGLAAVIEQLAGTLLPLSALESLILPSRMADYSPALLDELTLSGEVLWCGGGQLPGNDGWISLAPADGAELLLPLLSPDDEISAAHRHILEALADDQALFFPALKSRIARDWKAASPEPKPDADTIGTAPTDDELRRLIWDLVWMGRLTNDTIGPLRELLATRRSTAKAVARPPKRRYGRYANLMPAGTLPSSRGLAGHRAAAGAATPDQMSGRWSRLPERDDDPTRRAIVTAQAMLDRYGVLTRGAVMAEHVAGGFAAIYSVLKTAEESGQVRRGYFVEGLGASQFALGGAVDRLRSLDKEDSLPSRSAESSSAVVLAAADPANPYGAALDWPPRPSPEDGKRGHQPARKAGSLVVLVDGGCVIYVERGGRLLLSFTDDPALLQPAADALALAAREGALGKLQVEKADGEAVVRSALGEALEAAGFRPTARGGLRLRSR